MEEEGEYKIRCIRHRKHSPRQLEKRAVVVS